MPHGEPKARGDAWRAGHIAGFGLTTPNAPRLAEFYAAAFDCRCGPSERLDSAEVQSMLGIACAAQRTRLTVGAEVIELLQFDHPGSPYPTHHSPVERTFQHLALVVADMHEALLRLEGTAGWSPISRSGPQRLPASSGGVTAFKFRDPDGHPLEFLEFPPTHMPARWRSSRGITSHGIRGIDHSAISVADTAASTAFYRNLGFVPTARTLNQGEEQAALDGIADPHVEVTSLTIPVHPTPHLELLCYRSNAARGSGAAAANDVAATRILIAVEAGRADDSAVASMIQDPDGHRLLVVASPWPSA